MGERAKLGLREVQSESGASGWGGQSWPQPLFRRLPGRAQGRLESRLRPGLAAHNRALPTVCAYGYASYAFYFRVAHPQGSGAGAMTAGSLQ